MDSVTLIFPTQLFKDITWITTKDIYLIEDSIYFTLYKYHKLKLAYQRATMKYYYNYLLQKNFNVKYINFNKANNNFYISIRTSKIYLMNPIEYLLLNKLKKIYKDKLIVIESLNFLLDTDKINYLNNNLFTDGYNFSKFYKFQRNRFNILLDKEDKPIGGRWSYDNENRKKLPKDIKIPHIPKIIDNKYTREASIYVNKYFKNNYGDINFIYPINHKESEKWLYNFIKYKLNTFGTYQDAIDTSQSFLFHSVITPMLNIGLITDNLVIKMAMSNYKKYNVSIQNIEGFIRQVIGWRNYIMCIYIIEKPNIKIVNENNLYNKLWQGTTNIYPIDSIIQDKIVHYSYVNHIERLMVLGNYMKLCLINDALIYRMFMEWTIDSGNVYMYGNVYGMVLNRIKIMTKNYIASSNYIVKMSNFKNINNWREVFDALYYNYIDKKYDELKSDYGLRYQLTYWKKKKNKQEIIDCAKNYIKNMYVI